MTALTAFWRNETPEPPPLRRPRRCASPTVYRRLASLPIFLAPHLANHLHLILGPDTYRAAMKAMRHVYRQEFLQPLFDANAAAISIDLQAGKEEGTAAQGIFLKSTTGGTSGEIVHYVDSTGVTIFALLPDGSLLLRPLAAPPTGTKAGLKLCNVGGTLGVVNSAGIFTPLT